MTIIPNSRTPKDCNRSQIARFVINLYRDGDKMVFDTEQPKLYRDFYSLTGAEKDAYVNIVRLILERGSEAMLLSETEAAERSIKHKTSLRQTKRRSL